MKAFYALISIMLLSFTYSDDTKTCINIESQVTKKSDCHDLKFPDGYKDYHCCFYHYKATYNGKTEEMKMCMPLDKASYDKIDEYIDTIKSKTPAGYEASIESFDCNSYYLRATILGLLFILI